MCNHWGPGDTQMLYWWGLPYFCVGCCVSTHKFSLLEVICGLPLVEANQVSNWSNSEWNPGSIELSGSFAIEVDMGPGFHPLVIRVKLGQWHYSCIPLSVELNQYKKPSPCCPTAELTRLSFWIPLLWGKLPACSRIWCSARHPGIANLVAMHYNQCSAACVDTCLEKTHVPYPGARSTVWTHSLFSSRGSVTSL